MAIDVSKLNLDKKIETLEHIFNDMHTKSVGIGQSRYLLGGDTGVGKTSFVRDLSALLGLELLIIETPHLVEEHIIDIPFIVFKDGKKKTGHLEAATSENDFDVTFAKSNLHDHLTKATKVSDAALLNRINARPDLKLIWEKLGGTDDEIPEEIQQIRENYDVILFLDEFFRQTSKSIRNMLRSILNGRLGSNEIPDNVYPIFASNLDDSGVGEILDNEDFKKLNFDAPSVDEWFAYIISKYKNHKKVKLNMEIVNEFYELMKNNEGSLSHDDFEADVRVSPRRWEQLLVYISTALPVKDERDAALLLKNIESNFKNYTEGTKADIAKLVLSSVKKLIKDTQGISATENDVDASEWRDTLKHQLETRIKAGSARSYIPVVSGSPGIGKTKHIAEIAAELNLIPIVIDTQNLSAEEIIGTPLPRTKDDEISVHFSRPPLYDYIMKEMKRGELRFKKALQELNLPESKVKERIDRFENADVKYLLFFDELNRTDTKVFNAIRKVLLEKEFNHEYKLPKEAIIMAAINPKSSGTTELTKHVRDVFDFINAGASHSKLKSHISTHVLPSLKKLKIRDESLEAAQTALNSFIEHFRAKGDKIDNSDPHFYINIGETPVYISGREYTDLLTNLAVSIDRVYKKELDKFGEDYDYAEGEQKVLKAIVRAFMHSLEYIIGVKHKMGDAEFFGDLEEWILKSGEIDLSAIFKKKVESVKSLKSMLTPIVENPKKHLTENIEFENYIKTVDHVKFKEDLTEFLVDTIVHDVELMRAKTHDLRTLENNKIKNTEKEASKLEFILREIIHGIKQFDASNKMLEMVRAALRETLTQIHTKHEDVVEDVLAFNMKMFSYIKKV